LRYKVSWFDFTTVNTVLLELTFCVILGCLENSN
jgi:hypothetical protein